MKKLVSFFISAILISTGSLMAQSYEVNNEASSLSVLGTSTLHDWKINADTIEGSAELVKKGETLTDIKSLELNVPIVSMHSGLDAMDDHMRTAMTANESNSVMFKLTKVIKMTPNSIGGYTIQAEGDLTIVGNTQPVRLQVTMDVRKDGGFRFFGETMLSMTDYKVAPPTAEMGSIKTEKDVKVVFDVAFQKK